MSTFCSQYKSKWNASSRNYQAFQNKNQSWLEIRIEFPCNPEPFAIRKRSGRPPADFSGISERSKRRKTEALRSQFSPQELSYAAQMQLRAEGKLDSAAVMKDIVFSTPKRATKYKEAYAKISQSVIPYSSDKALSIVVEAKLTKFQYNIIRNAAKDNNSNIYPNYETITAAKKKCYPDNLVITESIAEAPLQNLLDHTVVRLFQALKEVVEALTPNELCNLHLITKWGCDGSSGMSEYKQKFSDPSVSDANIFLTSLVPLQLVSGEPNSKKKIVVWQNPRSSSPRFCRPIRIQLVHETTDISVKEMEYIENQISSLIATTVNVENTNIFVKHTLLFTMIDGKICNAVSENTSTQRCYLCGLTSKDFNKIDLVIKKEVQDKSKLRFGLSSLHAWIRFFECSLHLSYKLVIGQWQARGDENKRKVAEQKKNIQEMFRCQMGLLVDKPKPGYGSTNDGNTARRFFNDTATSAQITKVNEEIIKRFRIVLLTISSGYSIKTESFKNYCLDTAKKFVELYPWYNMPTTVHKILIHSAEILDYALLPIGQLGEEAQEARNKDIKRYRESFSRKFSRQHNMEDIFHNLLVSSDPYISSMKKIGSKKLKQYPTEVLQFLEQPEVDESVLKSSDEELNDSD